MNKYYVTYDDGDDCSTVWVMADSVQDAANKVKREYHDVKEITYVRKS